MPISENCALHLQHQHLYSTDGRVYLVPQGDGNLVLYSSQVANLFGPSFASAIFATGTYGATPGPFSLVLLQVCDSKHGFLPVSQAAGIVLAPFMKLNMMPYLCCIAELQPSAAQWKQPDHLLVCDSQPGH